MRVYVTLLCLVILGCVLVGARRRGGRRRPKPGQPVKTCNLDNSICVRTYGRSGRFSIMRGSLNESDPRTTTISFFSIKEKDADGNVVGNAGPRKARHAFQNFKNLESSFSHEENTTYKGVKAIRYNISATIPGPNATLNVPMYLFMENGTIDVCDHEEVGVIDGVLKYNVEIYNWKFCNGSNCLSRNKVPQYGAFIDFAIRIKKKGKAYKGRRWHRKGRGRGRGKWKGRGKGRRVKAQKFFFGSTSVAFPSVFRSDGQCTVMPEGYPGLRVKKRGAEYAVFFRFPRFNSSVVYDPVVNIQDKPGEPELNETAVVKTTAATAATVASTTSTGSAVAVNVTAVPTTLPCCASSNLLSRCSIFLVIFMGILQYLIENSMY